MNDEKSHFENETTVGENRRGHGATFAQNPETRFLHCLITAQALVAASWIRMNTTGCSTIRECTLRTARDAGPGGGWPCRAFRVIRRRDIREGHKSN